MTRVPKTASRPCVAKHQLREAHERINQFVVTGRLTMVLSRIPINGPGSLTHHANGYV